MLAGRTQQLIKHYETISGEQDWKTKQRFLFKPTSLSLHGKEQRTSQTANTDGKVYSSRSKTRKLTVSKQIPDPKSRLQQSSLTVVALATVVDYFVNRHNGTTATRLEPQKMDSEKDPHSHHQHSVIKDTNKKFINQSKEANALNNKNAENIGRLEAEITKLKKENVIREKEYEKQLEEMTRKLLQQESDHECSITNMNQERQRNMQETIAKYQEEIALLHNQWLLERKDIEKETLDLRQKMDKKVQEKVEVLIHPYINSYEENKSLKAVLEMKISDLHQLQLKLLQQPDQVNTVQKLNNQVTTLNLKNEDLQIQADKKNEELRKLNKDLLEAQRNFDEQKSKCKTQQQQIEELSFRLEECGSSQVPFNPVYSASPAKLSRSYTLPERRTPFRSIRNDQEESGSNKKNRHCNGNEKNVMNDMS